LCKAFIDLRFRHFTHVIGVKIAECANGIRVRNRYCAGACPQLPIELAEQFQVTIPAEPWNNGLARGASQRKTIAGTVVSLLQTGMAQGDYGQANHRLPGMVGRTGNRTGNVEHGTGQECIIYH
jgi:hypothetical protein